MPVNIPSSIDVDISKLVLGEMIHVKDLVLSEGLEVLADPEEVVAIVATPKVVEEGVVEEKEVEVVAKGKAAKAEE